MIVCHLCQLNHFIKMGYEITQNLEASGVVRFRHPVLVTFTRIIKLYYQYAINWYSIHWGRVTHICVSKQTIIGSDNGLSPGRRQAIIWTNAGILLIGPAETNLSEILIEIYIFSFIKMPLKMSSVKWRPSSLGLNVLKPFGPSLE